MGLDGPLGTFTDAVLGKMLELERAEVAYHAALGAQVVERIGATCVVNEGLPHPAFNCATSLDAEAQDPTQFVHQVELAFAHAGVPFALVCTPLTRPLELPLLLASRGYLTASRRTWMELMVSPPTAPDDPRIEVRGGVEGPLWAATASAGLEVPQARPLLEALAARTRKAPGHELLLAAYLGEPVGACEVSVDEGIGVVRRLAVKPPYRVREVARALLHSACEVAFARDAFRVLTRTFPDTGGVPVLESFGFVGMQVSEELVREYPPFLLD